MSSFEANLKTMPFAEQTILLRVFNSKDELMAILPTSAKQGTCVCFHTQPVPPTIGRRSQRSAPYFWRVHERAQQNPGLHPKLDLLLNLRDGDFLKIERIESSYSNLLANIHDRKASAAESEAFIELLNQGKVRAAEKVRDEWEPQTYVIDGVLNYFGTHGNQRMESSYWDKVPLKYSNYTDQDFELAVFAMRPAAENWSHGPQTVIMNQAFVNIGAYVAGGGV